jgi:hypothetical protein
MKIATWADDYNQRRPHSALGYLTPAAYAANLSATCDRLRNPDQLRRSHVAPPPPHGVKTAEALERIRFNPEEVGAFLRRELGSSAPIVFHRPSTVRSAALRSRP